ncbi:MFS transporter [Arthrobacter pityocampae]|uniref:MFS transporter n=1 Tax=Arthrobacter pityocampae TaxID=547334 RepID=A0A2S5IW07_9MICC|nr:MFS transporter [Arthrobacter pityocampae]PPB48730.1 MFS transporter [Arthrobacter pityocampae]
MPKGLLALALGGFGIGLTEFIIMGLMPEVAGTFGVTEAQAGWLITGYALSVAVGALVVTAAVTRLPRKQVLLGLLVLFILGNMLDAVAPTYTLMMLGRIIAALCHGAFFGIGSVVAGSMVAPEKKASAIAVMFTGLTVSNVLGVPLGTFLGQAFGWRSTFWAITAIGVVAFIGIALLVPATGRDDTAISLRRELRAFRSGQVWASLSITILGYGGMFGAFTYIAYLLTEVSGFPSSAVPWLLVVFGVGLFVGNLVGGRAADRAPDRSLLIILAALTVVLVVFALVAENRAATVISLILMGGFGFATVPGLQMRVMHYAGEATTLVSGANIGAFNIGNALGAWIGGVTISAGLGYTSPIWAGAVITFAAVVVLTLSMTRNAPSPRAAHLAPLDATRQVAPTR